MKTEERSQLTEQILAKIELLKKDIESYKELTKPIQPDVAIGRLSRMEAINSKSINENALYEAQATLGKLQHALKIIDRPDFGLCRECDEPIPVKRLLIMPEAGLCVQCAEELMPRP
jgi:DnaK suppressor protein